MADTTLNSVVIHNGTTKVIIRNFVAKESNLTPMPLYGNDSDATDVFDFGGVTKTISLKGVYVADTVAELKTWIDSIEALQQGKQDVSEGAPYEFVDDLRGTMNVKVSGFNSEYVEGSVTKIEWNLDLIQASSNG